MEASRRWTRDSRQSNGRIDDQRQGDGATGANDRLAAAYNQSCDYTKTIEFDGKIR